MKKYSYHQSPFYKCTTKRKLSNILRTDIKDINKIIKNVEDLTAYHSFKNRGRDITSPNNNLKKIQKRIDKLLTRIEIPDWVHGGKVGS